MSTPAGDQAVSRGRTGLPQALQLAVAAGPFLSMVDSNIVTIAVPDIAGELHTSVGSAQWTLSAYLVALAVTLPATTYLAGRLGTVRAYLAALIGFTLASAACAAAPSIDTLIIFRIAQGITGAPLIPLAMSLLYATGASASGSLVGPLLFFLPPALGPTLGGLLLHGTDWRVLFLVNVPLGAVAAATLLWRRARLPQDRADRTVRLDVTGFVLLAASLGLLIYAAGQAGTSSWIAADVWPLWATGFVLLGVYWFYARHRPHPAVRIGLLTRARTAIPVTMTALVGIVLFGMLFIIPVFLQDQAGHSELTTGLVLLPQGLAMGASTWIGQRAARRLGLRATVLIGLIILTLSTAAFAAVHPSTPAWLIAAILTGRGMAVGLILTPLLDAILLPLPANAMDDATTVFNIAQRLGGSIGIAALGSIYATAGFSTTIWTLAILAAAGIPLATALPSITGPPKNTTAPSQPPRT